MLKLFQKPIANLFFLHFIQVLKPLDVKTKFYNAEVSESCVYLGLVLCPGFITSH